MSPQVQFEKELEVFRTEVETAIQFLYAYLTVHAVAAEHNPVFRMLNTAPLFWNTGLGALQTAAFITLGRIFDQKSKHNVDRVLRIAQDNPEIFAKTALGARKQGTNPTVPEWLPQYLLDVYVPTAHDFRRLRTHIKKHRKIYEAKYRLLRNKFFAHKEVSRRPDVDALFVQTNVRELQKMLTFLGAFYRALWELFFNGRKPVLRSVRYSVEQMRHRPSPPWRSSNLQERITHETERFLREVSGVPNNDLHRKRRKQRTADANRLDSYKIN
jgi:hypothetical protein